MIGGNSSDLPHRYGYDQRPPREEIIDEIADAGGKIHATLTRNAYGCLILNTRDLMFIDIDFPYRRLTVPLPRFLKKSLGEADPPSDEELVLSRVRQTAERNSHFGDRIYRTKNGYRPMIHNHPVPSQSSQATKLLDAFDADPLYRRLCNPQQCFRARLTPKPWRLHLRNPPCRYPLEGPVEKAEFQRWDEAYRKEAVKFSPCRYLESIGPADCCEELRGLIELDDGLTKAFSDDWLA